MHHLVETIYYDCSLHVTSIYASETFACDAIQILLSLLYDIKIIKIVHDQKGLL